MRFDPAAVSLGKKPGVVIDRRTFKLSTYLDATLLPTPPSYTNHSRGLSFDMLGNDRYGDCTFAGAVHLNHATSRSPQEPPPQQVIDAYLSFTHGQDTGCYLLDVLNHWRTNGILSADDKIYAFGKLDPNDDREIHLATWLFGGLYVGIGLPITAQSQDVWDLPRDYQTNPDAKPYSWGGHCVYVANSDLPSGKLRCVTWGGTQVMTRQFRKAYIDEAYAVIDPDWLARRYAQLQGFSREALEADLAALA